MTLNSAPGKIVKDGQCKQLFSSASLRKQFVDLGAKVKHFSWSHHITWHLPMWYCCFECRHASGDTPVGMDQVLILSILKIWRQVSILTPSIVSFDSEPALFMVCVHMQKLLSM